MDKKNTRGGARKGAGRKKIEGDKSRAITVSCRPSLMKKAKKLYGSLNNALQASIDNYENE